MEDSMKVYLPNKLVELNKVEPEDKSLWMVCLGHAILMVTLDRQVIPFDHVSKAVRAKYRRSGTGYVMEIKPGILATLNEEWLAKGNSKIQALEAFNASPMIDAALFRPKMTVEEQFNFLDQQLGGILRKCKMKVSGEDIGHLPDTLGSEVEALIPAPRRAKKIALASEPKIIDKRYTTVKMIAKCRRIIDGIPKSKHKIGAKD